MYPLQNLEILMPQIFDSKSVVEDHGFEIQSVFFKEDSNLIDELR